MIYEIAQIKRFLAKHHKLRLENPENPATMYVVGEVPDGAHVIPIGRTNTPHHVSIKGGAIFIGEEVDQTSRRARKNKR